MFIKNQHITITWNDKSYAGKIIQCQPLLSEYLGQFVVIKLDTPVGHQKTQCFRVNGTAKPFGFDEPKATLTNPTSI